MKVYITYDNGRLDVFDDSRFTAQAPFGNNTMLANYELRWDQIDKKGLWLKIHHYDINSETAPKDPEEGIPKASRNRGWQFLLAEREEVAHIVHIKVDERDIAFRMGGNLVDAARFRQMVDFCIADPSKKSKAQCAVEIFETLSKMPDMSKTDVVSIYEAFGFNASSFKEAQLMSVFAPKPQKKDEADKKEDFHKGRTGWMEDLDNEDAD